MIKEFLLKKMIQSKMKDVPSEQLDQMIALISKNPQFFETIAAEVDQKVKQGKDKMAATMEVMQEHQQELKKLLG